MVDTRLGPVSVLAPGGSLDRRIGPQLLCPDRGFSVVLRKGMGSSEVRACFLPLLSHIFLSSGVTFSFFWKTQGEQSRPAPVAYGGQVISDGFKVHASGSKGSVELYVRENSMTWEASFNTPGEDWGQAHGARLGPRSGSELEVRTQDRLMVADESPGPFSGAAS